MSTGILNLTTAFKNTIHRKQKRLEVLPSDVGRGNISEFRISHKIKIGSWSKVSAVFRGTVNSGFFSLIIKDCDDKEQWFQDHKSVEGKYGDNGQYIETGILCFINDSYSSEWKFRPDRPLKPGKGKAIVGMFEERDYVDKNGNTINNRPHLDLQEKDIILYY